MPALASFVALCRLWHPSREAREGNPDHGRAAHATLASRPCLLGERPKPHLRWAKLKDMSSVRPIESVCFDLGGVLARLAGSWREACRWAGLNASIDPRVDEPFYAFKPYNAHELGEIGDAAYFGELRRFLGLASVEEALRAHLWVLGDPYPGTLQLVEAVRSRGLRTGCLSNTERIHWERMTSDFYPAIQAVESKGASHLLGARKPDQAIFEAFEAYSGFARDGTVFFDDSAGHVEAAATFGWRAVRVDPLGDTAGQMKAALAGLGVTL